MKTILEVEQVEKSYGASQVIHSCSFRIYQGEIYGLLGVNGAGKTTLMKMILGLQRLDNGRISVLGKGENDGPKYLGEIGSIIENPVFYEHLNAEEILSMHLAYMQKKGKIMDVLRLVGLENVGRKPISQYSLGMRQRLGLARAIVHNPRLLLLDEPLNGLDPIAIAQMRELMGTLAKGGMSILLSSHIIGEMRHTADRVGILSNGCICQEFSVEEKSAQWGEQFESRVVSFMRRESHGFV